MQKADPLVMRDFSSGIQTSVTSGLVGANQLRYAVNMYNDVQHTKAGTLKSRYGFNNFADDFIDVDISRVDADNTITGLIYANNVLFVAVYNSGTNEHYVYQHGVNAGFTGSWADIGASPLNWYDGGTDSLRFAYFVNTIFGGTTNGANMWHFSGNWGSGTDELDGAPSGTGLSNAWVDWCPFQGRLYAIVDASIYFSSLPSAANHITWDFTNNYFNVVSTTLGGNEDKPIALEASGGLMLIFTHKTFYTYNGISTQTDPLFYVGSINKNVIKTIDNNTFFVGEKNGKFSVYLYDGSYPVPISDPVSEFLEPTNWVGANPQKYFGSWLEGNNYCLSIMDVTLDGVTYPNVVLSYNLKSKSWTVYSIDKKAGTYNNFFNVSTVVYSSRTAVTSSALSELKVREGSMQTYTVVGGTSLGTSSTEDVGLAPVIWAPTTNLGDDIGQASNNPITILLQTNELEWGSRTRLKTVHKFKTFASGNYGCINVEVRVDGGAWEPLCGLAGKTTTIEVEKQGYYFEFRWIGQNSGEPFVFEGYDFGDWVDIEDYEI